MEDERRFPLIKNVHIIKYEQLILTGTRNTTTGIRILPLRTLHDNQQIGKVT